MGTLSTAQNRRLLFRTYAAIVGSLVLIAAGFDYAFSRLQDPGNEIQTRWADGVLMLIESRLAALPDGEWAAEAESLERGLGLPVRILPLDHFVQTSSPASETLEVFDSEGRSAWFRRSAGLDAAIQIGPLATTEPDEPLWIRLIPTLFYVSIAVIVSLWIWPLLRDVNVLTHAARSFAADYKRPIATRQRTTTLRELATSFDEMSERIRGLIQSQKELTSALSHEVRTPLARIRFAMAVMDNRDAVAGELESIDQDVQEIDRLIGTMLDYARLDYDGAGIDRRAIAIRPWLERIAGKTRAGRDSPRIEIDAPAADVSMDPGLMELALSNLLVNACRYANETVAVAFRADDGHYELAVDDDGPGIPEAERETVFEPFKRLDDSRNRQTGGYGLGLAIVARIAARHGGSARAAKSLLGGARMVIAWKP